MKRQILWALVVLLTAVGGYCGYRYYSETYLPEKQIADADSSQRELFDRIKPDLTETQPKTEHTADTDSADETAEAEETTPNPLADLLAVNDEAVGWITVPGTNIDFAIAQAADNDFYLHNGFDKTYNYELGCPFLDYRCKDGFNGFNSIVYGHHMTGRRMFADISLFKDSNFMMSCPTGTLLTENGQYTVRFFAYMTVSSDDYVYHVDFDTASEKEEYLDYLFDKANYTMNFNSDELKEDEDLRLLLLSTCTYEYWAARGVLAGVIE
ncbi:MAG: class B sortase [Oscillospiraceae bacterium]|nr:class B sortase [Oscillospiraceae bacterium]